MLKARLSSAAEIITLRAIALKLHFPPPAATGSIAAEIITLRAIALKPVVALVAVVAVVAQRS